MYVHTPVLLDAVLALLAPPPGPALMVDATVGEGGHAEAFLSAFPALELLGVDRDGEILERARMRLTRFGKRVRLCRRSFAEFFGDWELLGERKIDRILFDLGVSRFHYEESGRGFSFAREEPLDLRLDPAQGSPAAAIVNDASEQKLRELLQSFGEEKMASRIARAIVRARPLGSSAELAAVIARAVPGPYRYGRIHPATRTFQALRIAVNRELEQLPRALEGAFKALPPGGRMGVISFHSLEDRIVKGFFREGSRECTCPPEWPICQCGGRRRLRLLTRKPVMAGEEERRHNPAARSARLRIAERLEE